MPELKSILSAERVTVIGRTRRYHPTSDRRPERSMVEAAVLAAEVAARDHACMNLRREAQRLGRVYRTASPRELEAALTRAAIARGVPIEL